MWRPAIPTAHHQAEDDEPELFAVLDKAIKVTRQNIAADMIDHPTSSLTLYHHRAFLRAFNGLKAGRWLLSNGHWELADGVARQFYEMLLNLEEVGRREDQELAAAELLAYGALQAVRSQLAEADYAIATGRGPDDLEATADKLAADMEERFKQFLVFKDGEIKRDEAGRAKWQKSWCRKNTADLARDSGGMRPIQYRLMYSLHSEQVHAAPGALIGPSPRLRFPDERSIGIELSIPPEELHEREVHAIRQSAASLIIFYADLLVLTDTVHKLANNGRAFINRLQELMH